MRPLFAPGRGGNEVHRLCLVRYEAGDEDTRDTFEVCQVKRCAAPAHIVLGNLKVNLGEARRRLT